MTPVFVLQVIAFVIAAFRVELFSTLDVIFATGVQNDRGLPLGFCYFVDNDDNVYGDRICNNAITASIISVLVAMMLMTVDLIVPCTSSTAVCGLRY